MDLNKRNVLLPNLLPMHDNQWIIMHQFAMNLQLESSDSHLDCCSLQDTSSCSVSPIAHAMTKSITIASHTRAFLSIVATFDNK